MRVIFDKQRKAYIFRQISTHASVALNHVLVRVPIEVKLAFDCLVSGMVVGERLEQGGASRARSTKDERHLSWLNMTSKALLGKVNTTLRPLTMLHTLRMTFSGSRVALPDSLWYRVRRGPMRRSPKLRVRAAESAIFCFLQSNTHESLRATPEPIPLTVRSVARDWSSHTCTADD